jgi:hypothetical protein
MASNDNTLKTLGFVYQTYVALVKCLEMKENDKVIIEKKGDVTFISLNKNSEQLEVKHHSKKKSISDRSDEIWNTVWNWYNNFEEYHDIDKFILFTTDSLSHKSVFLDWNNQSIDNKYQIFKMVGDSSKKEETAFRKSYNKIFNTNRNIDKLKSILSKFEFKSEQKMINDIVSDYKYTVFKFISKKEDINLFVSSLVGILFTYPIKNKDWKISYEDFNEIFRRLSNGYMSNLTLPLLTTFEGYILNQSEYDKLTNKKFVSEIDRIDLHNEINDAINDYCKTKNTIIEYYESNMLKLHSIKKYQEGLADSIRQKKKRYKNKCKNNNDNTVLINNSQDMYFESMEMEEREIEGISSNRGFFQRGIIHSIIDDNELTWHLGDEK